MLGVRVEGWHTDGSADWLWPAAEKAGLPVMLLIDGRSAQVVRIAERHPQLTLIVDHMGVTADIVKAGKLSDAIDRTMSLARYPNVSVKLSAAPNYSTEAYPFRDFLRIFGGCSMLMARNAATGGPTLPTASARLGTVSALPISLRSCRSCRTKTRIGSWDAPLWRVSAGPTDEIRIFVSSLLDRFCD